MREMSLFKKLMIIAGGSFVVILIRLLLNKPFTLPLVFFWLTFVFFIVFLDVTLGTFISSRPKARMFVLSIGAALVLLAAIVWLVTVFIGYPLGLRSTLAVVAMIITGLLFWWARQDRDEGIPEKLR